MEMEEIRRSLFLVDLSLAAFFLLPLVVGLIRFKWFVWLPALLTFAFIWWRMSPAGPQNYLPANDTIVTTSPSYFEGYSIADYGVVLIMTGLIYGAGRGVRAVWSKFR